MEVSEHCKFNVDGVGLRTGRQGVPVAINQVLGQGNQIMLTEWKWRKGTINSFYAAHYYFLMG
jgi:hypothetical protein